MSAKIPKHDRTTCIPLFFKYFSTNKATDSSKTVDIVLFYLVKLVLLFPIVCSNIFSLVHCVMMSVQYTASLEDVK